MKSDAIGVYIKLNPVTDKDIIDKLEGKKKQTYIKQLIRDDIRKSKKLDPTAPRKRLFDYMLSGEYNNDKL